MASKESRARLMQWVSRVATILAARRFTGEQGQLAEELSFAEIGEGVLSAFSMLNGPGLAALDHIEAVSWFAFMLKTVCPASKRQGLSCSTTCLICLGGTALRIVLERKKVTRERSAMRFSK